MKISLKKMYLSPEEKHELLEVMEKHFQTFLRARSLTPYIDPATIDILSSCKVGNCFCVSTAPIYQIYGYNCHIIFELGQFDTDEKYKQYQDIGHWINQSFLIELKCILDTYITDWNQSPLGDNDYFELLRLCRNLFAHSSYQLGYKQRENYKQDYEKAFSLYKKLFGNLIKNNEELNLSITDFVIPFYEKLVELIKDSL
ncbi:MAG: hypothetical protein BWY18_00724 [Candidatus Cloacimonetes bacterium ADurb.Bin211]|nr:MAG: hypothetical protein BWY18_00724 [Candidatus Cloacimonetes bacterium ADurb.Bin211]